jgi:hypothetical protein
MRAGSRPIIVPPRYFDPVLLIACVGVALLAALRLRQDANWDLLNYHFYDPWAWLNGRSFDRDIAAAQLQTFHNPLADVPFYLLVAADIGPRVITLWLSLPTAIAGYFFVKIAWRVFADLALADRIGATLAATIIGFTGAMGVGQLGTTTDEWLIACFVIASLWLLVGEASRTARRSWPLLLAGVLMGIASGLKLTAGAYALALCIALLSGESSLRPALGAAATYSVGVLAGLVSTLGYWSYTLWTHFRNPLFPYANQFFRSPWWDAMPVLPRHFGPHDLREWLLLPFELLAPPPGFVAEVPYVDPRLPVLYGLALIAATGALLARARGMNTELPAPFRTTSRQWKLLTIAFVAAFILWAVLHSILRYTIPLEILSGVLIVGLFGYLLRRAHATAAVALAVIGIVATTAWSDWGRVDFGRTWFQVTVPHVDPDALVLLTVDAPMSYVLPLFPSDARFVGIRNNIMRSGQHNRLTEAVAAAIRDHHGPLYALSSPPGEGESALRAHGLERVSNDCSEVRSNMPNGPIELCRLRRSIPAK